MAGPTRTFEIRFDTRKAIDALRALERGLDRVEDESNDASQAIRRIGGAANRRRIQRLNQGLNTVSNGLTRIATRLVKGVSIAFAAMGAAAGVALHKTAAEMDRVAKLSRKIDFPVEALQEFGFVAEQTGMQVSTFEKGIARFTKNVGEAKDGYGTLTTALKKSNRPLLRQIKNTKDSEEAFMLMLKAIREQPDIMKSAALANAAFGRTGQDMILMAKMAPKELAKLREEMRKNGVFTMQQAEQAEAYNDAINSMKKSLRGLFFEGLTPLMPMFTRLARRMREWIIENKELIRLKVAEFFKVVKTTVLEVADAFKKWSGETSFLDRLTGFIKGIGDALIWVMQNWRVIVDVTKAVVTLIVVLKTLAGVLTLVNLIMSANPISLIVIAVMALVGAFTALVYWSEEVVAWFDSLGTGTRNLIFILNPFLALVYAIAKAASYVKENWEPITQWFKDTIEQIPDVFTMVSSVVKSVFLDMAASIGDKINWVVDKISWLKEAIGMEAIEFRIDTSGLRADIAALQGEARSAGASLRNRGAAQSTAANVRKYGGAEQGISSEQDFFQMGTQQTQQRAAPVINVTQTNNIKTDADPKSVRRIIRKENRQIGRDINRSVMDAYLGGF
jgi:hypothetical protein